MNDLLVAVVRKEGSHVLVPAEEVVRGVLDLTDHQLEEEELTHRERLDSQRHVVVLLEG